MTKVSGTRIRSIHQRRILDWLADGGGTVSEVSNALSMRMPHTSAALKKLRESGDVVRDDLNIRGSRLRLSSQGLARLEADGLDRLEASVRWPPPPGAAGIVLARDGSMLLLGYASKPQGPLIGLPDRPMDEDSGVVENSNGNKGGGEYWRWGVIRGDGPVWWDLDNGRRAEAPEDASPLTLAAWMERPKVMGVVRARLLDDSREWPLGVGSWFSSLPQGIWPDLPQQLCDGDVAFGRAGNSGPLVRPRDGVHALLGRRDDQALVLRAVAKGALCIADFDLLGREGAPIPFAILKHWLREVHPRLSNEAISERMSKIQSDLSEGISSASTRRLLADFPGREWAEEGVLDTRSLSLRAARAVLAYALESSTQPIVAHWRWPIERGVLDQLVADSRCRMVICEGASLELPMRLTSMGVHGKFSLELPDRVQIPVSLDVNLSNEMPENWEIPATPSEIIRGELTPPRGKPINQREAMWVACNLSSDGDDTWADMVEGDYPLAAWVATSSEQRGSRWRRISGKVDSIWASLAKLDSFDIEQICDLALDNNEAYETLVGRVRSSPMIMLDQAHLIAHPAMASALLSSTHWLSASTMESVDVACSAFLEDPIDIDGVMMACWDSVLKEKVALACPHHHALAVGVQDRDAIMGIITTVNHSLWKENALEWLRLFLSSTQGRLLLSKLEIPWPVLLCDSVLLSEDLKLTHHMDSGPGHDSLLDVLDALDARERGIAPPRGRTHPMVGWLFQTTVPIVPIHCEGDMEIHIALHRRLHA